MKNRNLFLMAIILAFFSNEAHSSEFPAKIPAQKASLQQAASGAGAAQPSFVDLLAQEVRKNSDLMSADSQKQEQAAQKLVDQLLTDDDNASKCVDTMMEGLKIVACLLQTVERFDDTKIREEYAELDPKIARLLFSIRPSIQGQQKIAPIVEAINQMTEDPKTPTNAPATK